MADALNEFSKRVFEIVTRNRLIRGLVGDDFNLFKERLVYMLNVALVFAFSFFIVDLLTIRDSQLIPIGITPS